nr:hypothetical protein [Mycolicibacterium komanii]
MRGEILQERVDEFFENLLDSSRRLQPSPDGPRSTPDFSQLLRDDLRRYFEDEVIPAVPSPSGGLVDETELRHEVAKKALIGLRVSALKRGAEELGAQSVGKRAEDWAEAIAKALDWDPDAVAKFVLDHEEDPTQEVSHSSRLFVLDSSARTDEIESEVGKYLGRYIRVAVAQWYIFTDSQRTGLHSIKIFGKHMSYTTGLEQMLDRVELRPIPKIEEVAVEIHSSIGAVEVDNASARGAKAATFAAAAALNLHMRDYVPNTGSEDSRVKGQTHGSSLFFLDLLENLLPQYGMNTLNLMVARFKFDNSDPISSEKPALKAVRFEGNHLLDSSQACRFIAIDGRPLANISLRVTVPRSDDGSGSIKTTSSFPIKISIEQDHVQVTTGLGDDPLRSGDVHDRVKDAVWSEILKGQDGDIGPLLRRMVERAESTEQSDRPSMLSTDLQRADGP